MASVPAPRPPVTSRLAAAAALLLLGVAVAQVVGTLWSSPGRVAVAVVAGVVGIGALWWALTTRGVVRWVSAAVVAAAVAAVVWALLSGDHVVSLLVVLGAGALSGFFADVALRDVPAPREEPRAPAARRPVLFMNPRAGGGTVGRLGLDAEARRLGAEVVLLGEPWRDLREMATEAVAAGADLLGAAGGDGTQALVAEVAAAHDVPFLCIPAGTRNHFALDLGLDRDDPAAALGALHHGTEARVDLGWAGDRVFVNNVSFGVYAEVVQEPGYRDAKIATVLQRLPDLVGPDAPPPDIAVEAPDGPPVDDAHVVLISNNPYRLEGGGGLGTRPAMDGGVLGVVTVRVTGPGDLARLASGRAGGLPGLRTWSAPAVTVRSSQPEVKAGVDGEALSLPAPLMLRSDPGALRVRLPRDRPGAPRHARLAAGAVQRLLACVAGRPDPLGAASPPEGPA